MAATFEDPMKTSRFGFPIEPSTEDFRPYVKSNARVGRIFRVDKKSTGTGWEKIETDITANLKAIFDLENLKTGWLRFPRGAAPDHHLVALDQALPDEPSDQHQHGIW